jgi:hypothetical protein
MRKKRKIIPQTKMSEKIKKQTEELINCLSETIKNEHLKTKDITTPDYLTEVINEFWFSSSPFVGMDGGDFLKMIRNLVWSVKKYEIEKIFDFLEKAPKNNLENVLTELKKQYEIIFDFEKWNYDINDDYFDYLIKKYTQGQN